MIGFEKQIAILCKKKGLSKGQFASQLKTSVCVISRNERDEMTPNIDIAKKLAQLLESMVGYLLGQKEESNIFIDPEILDRFKAMKSFKEEDKKKIYFTIDALTDEVTNRKRFSTK